MRRLALTVLGILVGFTAHAEDPAPTAEVEKISFSSQVAPILLDNCLACHGAKKAEGGYRLDNYEELLKAGDSGETPIATEKDGTSELLRRLSCDESERMPAESEALSAEQIETIRKWIASGAEFDGKAADIPLAYVIPPATYADAPASYQQTVPITAVAFTPNGEQIVVGGYHEVTVWNPADGTLLRRIGNIGQRVFSLAFSTDGKRLAVACGEPGRSGEVRLLNFESGQVEGVIARTSDIVLDLAFRPNSNELAVAAADSTIRIFDGTTLEEKHAVASHADWVTAVAWSDDGSRLVSASRDKSAKVYDGTSMELLASYLGHGAPVRGVAILSDGKQVVSTGADGKLHRWNIEDAKKTAEVGCGNDAFKLVRGPDFVLVPCADHRLLRINLADNKVAQEFKGHSDWVLAASLYEGHAVSGAFNGEVRTWNLSDGNALHAWTAKP